MGRFWGRGRFSERSASPPDPLSRRASGDWIGWLFGVGSACELGVSPIDWAMVTAADRAAATCQHGRPKAPAFPATRMRKQSICRSPTPQVRGGSVSRHGLTQAYRRRPYPQAEPSKRNRTPPNANRSSGERGLGGEALLSEKRPLPPASPHPPWFFEREREGGGFLQRSLLPRNLLPDFPHNLPRLLPLAMPLFAWYHRVDGICAAEGA